MLEIRSIKQAQEQLMKMKLAEVREEELEVCDILVERNGKLLCRKVSMISLDNSWTFGLRHEIWTDRGMFELNIPNEFIGNDQIIYMSGYAGSDDKKMIELFNEKYPENLTSEGKMLREILEDICRPQGYFNIPSYHWPNISDVLLNEINNWYIIGIPDALLICRESDVPKGNYEISDMIPFVVAIVNKKTAEEYFAEENAVHQVD